MATPPFILELRKKIGNDLLWLMGASVYIHRQASTGTEVLLIKRADNGEWTLVSGIVDPGENPATTAVREAMEEAGIEIEVERMLWTVVMEPVQYDNGDWCQYLDHGFSAHWVSGEPHPADGEATDVAWWPIDALPSPRFMHLEAMVRLGLENPSDVAVEFPA